MATLTNELNTIELGSTNWRNLINFNFEQLDKNRFFVVELDSNLPTSSFKNERFFFSKESKKTYFDDGTSLLEVAGGSNGTEIDLANNPNKYLKVNSAGTALEYVTISTGGGGLTNNATQTKALSIITPSGNSYSTAIGHDIYVGGTYQTIVGYNHFMDVGNYNTCIGNSNTNNNGTNNIFVGYNNTNNNGTGNIKVGNYLSHNCENSISIGNGFSCNKESTINISPDMVDVLNSNSINTRVGAVQNTRLHMRKSNLNTNVLTDVYLNAYPNNQSINLIDNSVANIEFKVTMLNESNYTDTCVINGEVIVIQTGSGVIVKHIDKKTVYKDSIFNGADIDFVAGYPRNVLFQVNTNGVTCKMVAKFDITYC